MNSTSKAVVSPGTVFHRYTVLETLTTKGPTLCHVVCTCGIEKIIRLSKLKSGEIKSCGCLARELSVARATKHGGYYKPSHWVWNAMLSRTLNPKHPQWHRYGGRGITVCDAWKVYEKFVEDMGEPPEGMQLDRCKNHLGYSKDNCRWATPKENSRNKENNVLVEYAGQLMPISEASEKSGVPESTIRFRNKQGLKGDNLFKSQRKKVSHV